jgi:hypothetical protein
MTAERGDVLRKREATIANEKGGGGNPEWLR